MEYTMNERMKNIQNVIKKRGIFAAQTRHYIISIVDQPNGDFLIATMLRDSMGMPQSIPKFIYHKGVLLQNDGKYPVKWYWTTDMYVGGLTRDWSELYWEEEAEEVKEYLHSLIE